MRISSETAAMLEWPSFLELYSTFISSPAARQRVRTITPVPDPASELQLSREALLCAHKLQIPSFSSLEDVTALLKKSAIENQIMDGIELYHVGQFAAISNEIHNQANGWKTDYPRLHERGEKLPDLRAIEEEVMRKIEPSGEVKEDATPELTRLQKQISHLKARLEQSLERYLRDRRYADALQEDYVTYRHGRAVLVIRTDQKSAIRGVIHGESGSGASLFVEPMNVLEQNNELAQLIDRQAQEIAKLLKELTALIGKHSDVLLFAFEQLVALDLILARGRFGKTFRCVIPEISETFHLTLNEARHPLLEDTLTKQGKQVVPVSVDLPPDKKALVITGPNTGGKTVFLKSCGLLSLMAHCGLPIPAEEHSTIPMLQAIEADIGDQQSISESLSTFSSHITNIVRILSRLEDCSLILLDELGTGTDPEEGAPLAVAILQELLRHDLKTMVTSHHSQTKMFAVSRPECVIAAMEFDERNLQPTYRVLIDQVGASHAFDMAQRLGMPDPILKTARNMTNEEQRQIREFQQKLQEKIQSLTDRQKQLEQEKRAWEEMAREQQKELDSTQRKLDEKLKTLKDQNTDLVRTLNAKVENLIDAIKEGRSKQDVRKQYKEEVAPIIEKIEQLTPTAEKPPQEFQPGDRVWVTLYKDFGELAAVKKGQAEVIIRNKRFTVPVTMLEKKQSVEQILPKGVQVQFAEKEVPRELNIIGQTVDEALGNMDKYLDDAFLSQLPEVRIIHGHGMGKLKRAVEEMLTTHPHVLRYHSESQQRGGSGVTVVELKTI